MKKTTLILFILIALSTHKQGWSLTISGTTSNSEAEGQQAIFGEMIGSALSVDDKLRNIEESLREPTERRNEIRSVLLRRDTTIPPEQRKTLQTELDRHILDIQTTTAEFIKDNINNPAGQRLLLKDVMTFSSYPPELLEDILSKANEKTLNDKELAPFIKFIRGAAKTAIGKPYVDFQLYDTEGNPVSFSDYVGKAEYVLLDFWASWCGPCLGDLPFIKKAYEIYKDRGFKVVSVSIDTNHEAWTKKCKELNKTWPQLSKAKDSRDNIAADLYGVLAVPWTFLIDKNGIIINKNIRREALLSLLAELMP